MYECCLFFISCWIDIFSFQIGHLLLKIWSSSCKSVPQDLSKPFDIKHFERIFFVNKEYLTKIHWICTAKSPFQLVSCAISAISFFCRLEEGAKKEKWNMFQFVPKPRTICFAKNNTNSGWGHNCLTIQCQFSDIIMQHWLFDHTLISSPYLLVAPFI